MDYQTLFPLALDLISVPASSACYAEHFLSVWNADSRKANCQKKNLRDAGIFET